jgi:hypothetical protein
MKNISRKQWVITTILIIALLIPSSVAIANSPYPPFRMWFRISPDKKPYKKIISAQLIGCTDNNCENPMQLAAFNYGTDNEVRDLLGVNWELKCAENRCYVETWLGGNGVLEYSDFQLIITYTSETLISRVTKFPDCTHCTTYWEVDSSTKPSLIREDAQSVEETKSSWEFLLILTVNAIAELMAGLVFCLIVRKSQRISIPKLLGAQIYANFLSYPFVWTAIPSFAHLQYENDRSTAIILGIALIIFSVFSVWVVQNLNRKEKKVDIAIIIFMPIFIVSLFTSFIFYGYGYSTMLVGGLSSQLIIIIAEVFAVIYETIMVYLLRKRDISFIQSFLICFTANVLSCILGLLI